MPVDLTPELRVMHFNARATEVLRGVNLPEQFLRRTAQPSDNGFVTFQQEIRTQYHGPIHIAANWFSWRTLRGEEAAGWCMACGCHNGEWGQPGRQCIGVSYTPCGCGHFRCQNCGRYCANGEQFNSIANACTTCRPTTADTMDIPEDVELNTMVFDTQHEGTMVLPFEYGPTHVYFGPERGNISITATMRQRIERADVYLAVSTTNAFQPQLIQGQADARYRQPFPHYHVGCWGHIQFNPQNGETAEQLRDRLQRDLRIINATSLADRNPRGMVEWAVIETAGLERVVRNTPAAGTGWTIDPAAMARRERAARQALLGLHIPNKVLMMGLGGVGWNLARGLVLAGVQAIAAADNDTLATHNSNRLDVTPEQIRRGDSKISAFSYRYMGINGCTITRVEPMATTIYEAREVALRQGGQTVGNNASMRHWQDYIRHYRDYAMTRGDVAAELLIDSTDDLIAQQMYWCVSQELGLPYLRVGYDGGWHITVTSRRMPMWQLPGTNPRGYAVPAWIMGAETAASIALMKICLYPELEFSGDARELFASDQYRAAQEQLAQQQVLAATAIL